MNTFKRLMSHDINRSGLVFFLELVLAWLIANTPVHFIAKFVIAEFDGGPSNGDEFALQVLMHVVVAILFLFVAVVSFPIGYEAATMLYRKYIRSQWLKSVADLSKEEAKRVAEKIGMRFNDLPREYWNRYSLASLASIYGTVLNDAREYFGDRDMGCIVVLLHDLREHYSQRQVERFVRLAGKRHAEVKKILNQALNTCLAQEPNRQTKIRNRSLEKKAERFM